MNQIKIGEFLKELRKEKGLTQEQLAEQFNVSRRSVSRWETGSNLPDVDILIEMADYYEVDLRELIDGERKSEKMNEELKETVLKVAEYSNEEKKEEYKNCPDFLCTWNHSFDFEYRNKVYGVGENLFCRFFGRQYNQFCDRGNGFGDSVCDRNLM